MTSATAADMADIAIVGLGCRFPGAASPERFWDNLVHGRDGVGEIPRDRWDSSRYYEPAAATARTTSRWGGFIDDAYSFDAGLFRVSDEEATTMDPQQRLFLETAWQTLEHAGYAGRRSDGRRIGLFVGASQNNYLEYHLHSLALEELQRFRSFERLTEESRASLVQEWKDRYGSLELHPYTAVNNLLNMIAARTSHTLNLKGPSMAVDTACSASLVAVHLACESLRRGECDMAIAGGVNLLLTPTPYLLLSRSGALSPTGRCRVFDAAADGFVPGEGAGAVMLKPLESALRDRDSILAVIKASAVNNDGRSLGVMAPNPDGQRDVIASLYRMQRLSPRDIQYVEAHGTGTPIGDPSEVRALTHAFGEFTPEKGYCGIGSVKANIGHLLSAAGIASLIKVVLSLRARRMPPGVHLRSPNPLIKFQDTPFFLLDRARDWETEDGKPRRAAINSFGFGGTNCHMVVEEAGAVVREAAAHTRSQHVLCISARSGDSLRRRATEMAAHLAGTPGLDIRDVCFTANAGRVHFPYRAAITGGSLETMVDALHRVSADTTKSTPARLALMCTGQGGQYPGMARGLYETQPTFKRFLDEAGSCFDGLFEAPLVEMMLGGAADAARLARTDVTQPVMFSIDYAVGRLLLHWGIQPAAMLGHSVGEYAAACLAGVMDLADAARIVAARGRLMHALPSSGAMAAVFLSSEQLAPWLEPYAGRLWIAAYNGSHQVVSGHAAALDEFLAETQARGATVSRLRVSQAFHTPLMEPILDDFRAVLESVTFRAPRIPLLSNVTGEWIDGKVRGIDAAYWSQHVLAPVRFEQSVRRAVADGITVLLEAGPDKTLAGLARAITGGQGRVHIASALDRKRDNWESLSQALAGLYEAGASLDFEAVHADDRPRAVALPAYPFDRQTFRPEVLAANTAPSPRAETPANVESAPPPEWFHTWVWTPENLENAGRVPAGAVLLFTRDGDTEAILKSRFDPALHQVFCIRAGARFEEGRQGVWTIDPRSAEDYRRLIRAVKQTSPRLGAVVHAWNAEPTVTPDVHGNDDDLHASLYSLLFLAQAIWGEANWASSLFPVLLTTHRGCVVRREESPHGLHQATAIALAQALVQEDPRFDVRVLDIDAVSARGSGLAAVLFDELQGVPAPERIAALRDGRRYVRSLAARPRDARRADAVNLAPGDTCLIVGGASGIGAELALDLASRGVNLVLTGRQPAPSHDRAALIRQLERMGSQVLYRAVDVADRAGMEELVAAIRDRFGALHGVVHAGGVVDRHALALRQKTAAGIADVLAPKLRGTVILDEVTRGEPLKFFVLYSSIAASERRWSAGLADYAAANAFLDIFSVYRERRGPGRSLAINWSLWEDRGMGRDPGLAHLIRSNGLRPLKAHQAVHAFHDALSLGEPVVHVIDFDATTPAPIRHTVPAGPEKLAGPRDHIRLVQQIVAAQLGAHERDVDGDRNFRELGLDSNGAVAVTALLGEALGQTLHPTLLFEYQTPNRLAAYLDAQAEKEKTMPVCETKPDATPVITVGDADDRASREPRVDVREQDIAIVGMACKLPGAQGLEEYWQMLVEGRTAIGEAPADRLPAASFEQGGKAAHISYSKWGAFVDRPYDFDPMFFGISPREAAVMDPQQRLFLEVSWQALQQSGYGERRPDEVGVFVGCEQNYYGEQFINYQHYELLRARFAESDWFRRLAPADRHDLLTTLSRTLKPAEISSDVVAGNGTNEIAARLSHCLDLKGPSVMVNTACSSSLVALHWACESLRSGESKMAVVGGVYLNFGSTPFVFLSRLQALSPDGTCAPFDREARGMVLGEGVSALILKPLRQAVQDRDFIHAVIKGSAINNDGHSQGITVPSPDGQAAAIRKAYRNADLSAEHTSYIECHGTGTSLGDPIEVAGLTQAFRSFTERSQFCALGSVKSSIGHMLAGAGLASVIKVVLAMKHRLIPPTVGFTQPNPYIDFASSPFFVAAGEALPWTGINGVRRAGVNAFGFGGTNSHLILEEAPELPARPAAESPARPYLVLLNGRTPQVVGAVANTLRAHLEAHAEPETGDVAFSMNTGQREMACKAALVAGSRDELLARLAAIAAGANGAGIHQGRSNPRKATSLYLSWDDRAPFTAEESEELARHLPIWASARRAALDACLRLVPAGESLAPSAHTFAAQYALGRLLMALDISPAGLLARKTGVLAATCLTGGATLPEAALSWGRQTYPGLEPPLPSRDGRVASDEREIRFWKCAVTVPAADSDESWSAEDLQKHVGPGGVMWNEAGAPPMTNKPGCVALDPKQPPVHRLLDVLGRLYVAGVKLDSLALLSGGERKVLLPTYPFEHSEYRVSPPAIDMEEIDVVPAAPAVPRLPDRPSLGEASRRTSRAALIKELAAAGFHARASAKGNVYDAF